MCAVLREQSAGMRCMDVEQQRAVGPSQPAASRAASASDGADLQSGDQQVR